MPAIADLEFAIVQVAPALAVQLHGWSSPDPAAIGDAMQKGFPNVMTFVVRHGLTMNGQPRAVYTAYDPSGVSFILALPVASAPAGAVEPSSITVDTLPGTKAYRFTHRGPYQRLADTYRGITAFMKEKGWMESEADWTRYMPMWEEYQNDPETTPPDDLVTYVYLPAP